MVYIYSNGDELFIVYTIHLVKKPVNVEAMVDAMVDEKINLNPWNFNYNYCYKNQIKSVYRLRLDYRMNICGTFFWDLASVRLLSLNVILVRFIVVFLILKVWMSKQIEPLSDGVYL